MRASRRESDRGLAVLLSTHPTATPRQRLLLERLAALGYRPLTVGWDRSRRDDGPRREREDLLTVGTVAPLGRRRLLLSYPRYRRALARTLEGLARAGDPPRVVVAGHLLHLPLASRFPGSVWIYDCAEYYAENLAAYWGPFERAARPLVRAWERRLLAPLVGILTVDSRGDWYERRLAATGLPVLVVPNYPSRGDDPPEIPPPVMHGDGVLAYVGGIQEDKGLDVMLEAVRLLRRTRAVRLLLVGPVAGLREDLRARIRALGLPDEAVETLPPVAYRDLVALLSARSDVGFALYQSGMIARGLGWRNARKVFTYMQAGLAVLVPKEGEIARPVLDAGAGLAVRAEDPVAVAAAVSALLADPEELARTRRRSRSAFLARHNWEGFVPVLDAWLADRLSAATSVTDRARSRGRKEVGRG